MVMESTANKPILCKAAIAWNPKEPLSVEDVEVEAPRAHEVRVKVAAFAVCHTDQFTLSGGDPEGLFPSVLGHEASGVVESVGDGVTNVAVGDHVIMLYIPECGDCKFCHSPKTNLCSRIRSTQGAGVMPEGTSRIKAVSNGKALFHYMGISAFSEYSVVADISIVKIRDDAPLEKVCLLGCGIATGIGAARNTSKVEKGSRVAVFGAGAVGLSAIQGAQICGASEIYAIDINEGKFEMAKKFGATHCINPLKYDKPIQQVLIEMTDGGFDYTFECIGRTDTMRAALECCHKGWGESCIIGVAGAGQEISTRPFQLVTGRVWRGSAFGGFKGRTQMPGLVDEYMDSKINVDDMITKNYKLSEINQAFDDMISGKNIRGVVICDN